MHRYKEDWAMPLILLYMCYTRDALHWCHCRGARQGQPHQRVSHVFCVRAGVDMREAPWIIDTLTNLWCSLAEWFGSNGLSWVLYMSLFTVTVTCQSNALYTAQHVSCAMHYSPLTMSLCGTLQFRLQFRRGSDSPEAGLWSAHGFQERSLAMPRNSRAVEKILGIKPSRFLSVLLFHS